MIPETQHERVVVIGGGFGGINVAKGLSHSPASVVLVDRRNFHLFQPLLYQVATAELEPSNIAAPLRQIFADQKNVDIALGDITSINLDQKTVEFDGGECSYDYLVIAMGMRQSYYGHDEYKQFAPGLKSIDDALEVRRRILLAFEKAEWEKSEEARRAKLTFVVVVGGGPRGVELAGTITDVAKETLYREFHRVQPSTARVILVDGGQRLVPAMPEDLSQKVHDVLDRMGVDIRLDSRVTDVDDTGIDLETERIDSENVFWVAGVQGQAVAKTLGVELDRAGRIVVGPDMLIPNHPEVFVIGDAAAAADATTNKPVPGLAQGAIQSGRFVARIIANEIAGKQPPRPAFSYYDKGSMAMIGRGNAVAAIGNRHFGGFLGWISWLLIHVMFLVGFGNKLLVLSEWFWNFTLYKRRAWLITSNPTVNIKKLREPTFGTKQHPNPPDQQTPSV